MSRAYENSITSAIQTIYSAFKTVRMDEDNPFNWYDREFSWCGKIIISGRQPYESNEDWNRNFVWYPYDGEELVVDWYKYWPRGVEINRKLTAAERIDFLIDVAALVQHILKDPRYVWRD